MAARKTDRTTRATTDIVAVDTSCLVALVCGWHEHHGATRRTLERVIDRGARLTIAGHALLEAYSVLTRLPAPHRLAPAVATELLRENFHARADVVTLGATGYWSLLEAAPGESVHGGRSFDALIVACARKANAREILTLNARHFASFANETFAVTSPTEGAGGQ